MPPWHSLIWWIGRLSMGFILFQTLVQLVFLIYRIFLSIRKPSVPSVPPRWYLLEWSIVLIGVIEERSKIDPKFFLAVVPKECRGAYFSDFLLSGSRGHFTSGECILLDLTPKFCILHIFWSPSMSIDLTLCYQWYMWWILIWCLDLRTPSLVCYVRMGLIYDLDGCYEILRGYGVVSCFGDLCLALSGMDNFCTLVF